MASILAPVLYLVVLVGSLLLFSRIYRKRVASRLANDPWFPSHPERDTYVTLLQQSDPSASEQLLKAALLRRAVADVHRIIRIREDKAALNNLLQKGSISDELWTKFLATEKELEAEIVDVVAEANSFREGWGQIIFQTANEMVQNERTKDIYSQLSKGKSASNSGIKKRVKASSPSVPVGNGPATKPSSAPNGVAHQTGEKLPSDTEVSPAQAGSPATPSQALPQAAPAPPLGGKKGKKKK